MKGIILLAMLFSLSAFAQTDAGTSAPDATTNTDTMMNHDTVKMKKHKTTKHHAKKKYKKKKHKKTM